MLAVGWTCEIRVCIRVMRLGRLGTIDGADKLAILPLDACHVQTQRPFSVLACSIQNWALRLKSYRLNWEPKVLKQTARKLVSLVTTQIVCESRRHSLFRRQLMQQQEQCAGSPRVKILYPKHIVYQV